MVQIEDRHPSMPIAQSVYDREKLLLAPYAMHSANSLGRIYPEAPHPYRGPFQRDRDRILHSSAFRRLSGKMQVFTGEMGDYHRTRLTHTQEVASIARTVGRTLKLNEDLIEALALMHDLGHPPYGHAGEDALNECAEHTGGFSHNQFGLVIVQEMEIRFGQYPGLNLTREVLAGQTARIDKEAKGPKPLLEVQLVDAADSMTYDAHDTDDAIKLGLVNLEEMKKIDLIAECIEFVTNNYVGLNEELMRQAVVHRLLDCQVSGLVKHCQARLEQLGLESVEEAMNSDFLISVDGELSQKKKELEKFLHQNVYRHPKLKKIRERAQSRLKRMYYEFCENPDWFPEKYRERANQIGIDRMAVEYIAGMTDHFCEEYYQKMFGDT
ncbi:MAG: dGTP triphosphohydrolase [Planctomycetota bacterium]